MTARLAKLRRVEALEASITRPDACSEELAGEIRALMAAVPRECEQAALLRRLEHGTATDADRAKLVGCSLGTLRVVVGLWARI